MPVSTTCERLDCANIAACACPSAGCANRVKATANPSFPYRLFFPLDCHVFGVDPPAIGFRCSYGWRAFASLLEQVRFMATEPHVIARCLRAFLHLSGLAAIQDLVDVKGSSVRPANNQRVNSPLVGYMHNNANVHFMHARSSSFFHLVVHAIYYRTIVR